ncbi:MAG: alpha/beta fold hydrolase [Roseovarius sp.]|nr:alpha/beta fold hydrolase [Roseovarius sp.]
MPVSSDGAFYNIAGPENATVVALIHGLGLTSEITWKSIMPCLASDFRVLCYDLPGHGLSAMPRGRVDLTMLGNHLIALFDEIGVTKASLVGFSLGGMINRRVTIDHPGRVSALAILNSPHERGAQQQKLVEKRVLETAKGGPQATIDGTLERWFTPSFRYDHPEVVESVRNVVLSNNHENYAAHRRVLAEGVPELIRPCPPIAKPAIVITCEHDSGSTPAMSNCISMEIADAETIVVPHLRHLGLIENPELFGPPIRKFLNRIHARII